MIIRNTYKALLIAGSVRYARITTELKVKASKITSQSCAIPIGELRGLDLEPKLNSCRTAAPPRENREFVNSAWLASERNKWSKCLLTVRVYNQWHAGCHADWLRRGHIWTVWNVCCFFFRGHVYLPSRGYVKKLLCKCYWPAACFSEDCTLVCVLRKRGRARDTDLMVFQGELQMYF